MNLLGHGDTENILLQSEFDNSINGKLSGNEDNWVYQFNLPTTSKVNLSILIMMTLWEKPIYTRWEVLV